jgi:hypothetical protein
VEPPQTPSPPLRNSASFAAAPKQPITAFPETARNSNLTPLPLAFPTSQSQYTTTQMKIPGYTRHPWVAILMGAVSLLSAGSWLQEFAHTGQITMQRAGITTATYSGSLAVLVVATVSLFSLYLLCLGGCSLLKKRRNDKLG